MNKIVKVLTIYTLVGLSLSSILLFDFGKRIFSIGLTLYDFLHLIAPFLIIPIFYILYKTIDPKDNRFMIFFLLLTVLYTTGSTMNLIGEMIERGLGYPRPNFSRISYLVDEPIGHGFLHLAAILFGIGFMDIQFKNPNKTGLGKGDRFILHLMSVIYAVIVTLMIIEGGTIYLIFPITLLASIFFSIKIIRNKKNLYNYPALLYFLEGFLLIIILIITYGLINQGFPQLNEITTIFSYK